MAIKGQRERRRIGRPPAGACAGEKVKDYPQLSIRLPADVKAKLHALSLIASRPQWRIITDAIDCYLRERSDAERKMVDELAGRRTRTESARARSSRRS
jgi:predicted transcriptional regulator